MDQYRINLEMFEGPMDLLLYLIRKNDLDIYDIPIAFITEEYLKYLNTLKELNIDVASEFLVIASELAHIKSRMLLPQDALAEEEEEDPRADLVRRLIEYQRYKEAAEKLAQRSQLYRDVFVPMIPERRERAPLEGDMLIEGNAFHLLTAFNKIISRLPGASVREVTQDRISVSERIFQLIEVIKLGKTIPLEDLLPMTNLTRHTIVVTFLALLEMVRLKIIKVYQGGKFETIYITGAMKEEGLENVVRMASEVSNGAR